MKTMIENEADKLHRGFRGLRVRLRRADPADRSGPRLGRQASGGEAMSSVLYDAPGRRAKRRNVIYRVVFVAPVRARSLWWVVATMADKNQLRPVKWKPFLTEVQRPGRRICCPGLVEHPEGRGPLHGHRAAARRDARYRRLSDHALGAGPAGVVVEFFRSIPVLLLMMFANEFYVQYADIGIGRPAAVRGRHRPRALQRVGPRRDRPGRHPVAAEGPDRGRAWRSACARARR